MSAFILVILLSEQSQVGYVRTIMSLSANLYKLLFLLAERTPNALSMPRCRSPIRSLTCPCDIPASGAAEKPHDSSVGSVVPHVGKSPYFLIISSDLTLSPSGCSCSGSTPVPSVMLKCAFSHHIVSTLSTLPAAADASSPAPMTD